MSKARWFIVTFFAFAIAAGALGQTLTVNKVQETLSGQTLDSTNVNLGTPMVYRITITSSDANKNPNITVTDTLPPLFTLIQVDCAGQGAAKCPNGAASQTNIPTVSTGNLLMIGNLNVPAGSATSLELRIIGYFTAPSSSLLDNKVEAVRQGETVAESTAKDSVSLTIPLKPLPVDLQVTKSGTPATGTTSTIGMPGTTHHYKVTVKNNGPADVYLGGFTLTDVLRLVSGSSLDYKLTNFTCPHAACPVLATNQSFTGSLSTSPAFKLQFSSPGLLMNGSSLTLEFDAEFSRQVNCGTNSTVVRNEAFVTLANTAGSIADTVAGNNTATADVTSAFSLAACPIGGGNQTQIMKTQVSPANPVTWGQSITYRIDFKNNGTTPLTNVTLNDWLLPSAQAPAFTATIGAIPICTPACTPASFDTTFPAVIPVAGNQRLFGVTFPSVPAGQMVSFTFMVRFAAPCDMTPGNANIPIDNYASASTGVDVRIQTLMTPLPDCGLAATKRLVTSDPIVLGQPVEFEVIYSNPFSQPVTMRTLKDAISLTSATYGDLPITILSGTSCTATPLSSVTPLPSPVAVNSNLPVKSNTPGWNGLLLLNAAPVTFAPGASLKCNIRFVAKQPTGCQGAGTPQLANFAFVDTGDYNTNLSTPPAAFATASAKLPLCRDVAINKSAPNVQSFTPGQTVTYTIRVTNNDQDDPVAGVLVDDPIPPGFTYVSSSCTACSGQPQFAAGHVTATIPTIPANGFVVITVVVTAPSTGGSYNNTATISFANNNNFFNGPGTVLSSPANVQVLTPRLTKSYKASDVANQGTITFTITNVPGNPVQNGITFTDTLSSGFQILGQPTTTCQPGSVSATGNAITFRGGLAAGQASCTVTVRVTGSGCNTRANITNTNNIDPTGVNLMVNVKECPAALTVNKAVSGAPPGFTGTFKFNVVCSTPALVTQTLSIVWPSTSATLTGLPAGSTCTVVEDPALPPPPAGFAWVGVPVSNPANGVVMITKEGPNQISFTNTMRPCDDRGQLKITKRLEGVPPNFTGTFTFNVSCWSGTTLFTQQAQVTIPGSPTVVVNGIPTGSTCTVAEVAPLPTLPSGWFWQSPSYLPASGQVVLIGTCCGEMVVINRAKFCCVDNKGEIEVDSRPNF